MIVDWSYFGRSSTPTDHFLSPGNTLPVGQGCHQRTQCLLRTKGQNGTFPYKSQHMLGCHCAGRTFRGYYSASKALGQQRSDITKQPLSGWWDQMVYSFNYIWWMSTIHTYVFSCSDTKGIGLYSLYECVCYLLLRQLLADETCGRARCHGGAAMFIAAAGPHSSPGTSQPLALPT